MGTAIKHPVPNRVKLSFVFFDIRALWRSGLSVRVPGCQKIQMTVWYRMLYSCTHMATVVVKGLNLLCESAWHGLAVCECRSGVADVSHAKSRVPSWCDRILWHVHKDAYYDVELNVELNRYMSVEEYVNSDHKPVVADCSLQASLIHCCCTVSVSTVLIATAVCLCISSFLPIFLWFLCRFSVSLLLLYYYDVKVKV